MDETEKAGWGDRFACAGVAFFVGAPTALIAWLVAICFSALFHVHVQLNLYWVLKAWGAFILYAFFFPHLMDVMFGSLWRWLLKCIGVIFLTPW